MPCSSYTKNYTLPYEVKNAFINLHVKNIFCIHLSQIVLGIQSLASFVQEL